MAQVYHHSEAITLESGAVLPEVEIAYDTFGTLNGKKIEAYISLSNREYGIELTGAPAVYAPQFHDRVLAMRKMLVLPTAGSTAENTQH